MDSFMVHLLRKHDVDLSDVTIVDDNASLEWSAALFLLSQLATTSSSPSGSICSDTTNNATNKPCRWSNITDDAYDLRIANRIVSDMRWSLSSQSTTSTSASTSQSKSNVDINNQGSSSVAVASRAISSNRNHQSKSFPGNRGSFDNCSNDVFSPSTIFEAREDKLKQLFISSSNHDDDNDDDDDSMTGGGEEEEIESYVCATNFNHQAPRRPRRKISIDDTIINSSSVPVASRVISSPRVPRRKMSIDDTMTLRT